jgi:hypothetical protein
MMNAEKKPYELLVRWGRDGKLQGAHVQWAMLITDDTGAVVGCYPGHAEPVAVRPDESGFPLSDVLNQMQIDALTALTAEQERSATLAAQFSASQTELATQEQKTEERNSLLM